MALQGYPFSFTTPTPGSTGLDALGLSIPGSPLAIFFTSNGGETSGTFFSSSTRRYHMHSFAVPPGTGSRAQGLGAVTPDQYSFGSISHGTSDSFGEFYSEEHSVAFIDNFGAFGTARFPIAAHIDSVDALGGGLFDLTLDYTTNEAANNFEHIVHGLALYDDGVDPIASVVLFKWSSDATSTPRIITDLGMQPDVVWSIGNRTEVGPTSISAGGKTLMYAMNCTLQQVAAATNMSNGLGQSVGIRRQEAVAAIGIMDETSNWTMALTAMNSDGWELLPSTTAVSSSQAFACASLCFQNVSSYIAPYVKPNTTTGADPITTPDVNGTVAVLFGVNNTTNTGMQNFDRFAVGFAASASATVQAQAGSSQRTTDTPMSGVDYTNRAYAVVNNDTETVQALIDSVSFGTESITPNWFTNDAELTETLLLVLGTGGGGTCAGPGGTFAGTWVDTQMVPVFA